MKIFIKLIFLLVLVNFYPCESINYKQDLDSYLLAKGHKITEGHVYSRNTNQPIIFKNLLNESSDIFRIAEIGFNAGHSSLLFLTEKPNATIYSFDLGIHTYVKDAKKFIDEKFMNRHILILGDSNITIPNFYRENSSFKFDLIFIDGGHTFEIALNDIKNMSLLAHDKTIVIIDDAQPYGEVRKAIEYCLQMNLIKDAKFEKSNDGTKEWVICKYQL